LDKAVEFTLGRIWRLRRISDWRAAAKPQRPQGLGGAVAGEALKGQPAVCSITTAGGKDSGPISVNRMMLRVKRRGRRGKKGRKAERKKRRKESRAEVGGSSSRSLESPSGHQTAITRPSSWAASGQLRPPPALMGLSWLFER